MNNLLYQLPAIPLHKTGWPWTEETDVISYKANVNYPKISVVTISYNQGKYIEETIRSVLLQNYPNLEYIVIDGGSIDESVDIIKKYEHFLSFWVSEKDKGPANALNKGFSNATGDIYYYINSDDLLLPNAFAKVVSFVNKNPEYEVYYGHGYINNEHKSKLIPTFSMLWNLNYYRLRAISIFQPATFIRKSIFNKLVQGFNEQNTTHWDGELLVDLALINAKFIRFNLHIAIFRLYSMSISGGVGGETNFNRFLSQRKKVEEKINSTIKLKNYPIVFLYAIQALIDPIVSFKRIFNKLNL